MCEARKFAFIVFAFLILTALAGVSAAKTIYVPDNYAKIQWAVDNASVGDTIVVRDGVYVENIKVDKKLTITSENGPENCIVRAADSSNHVFKVTADYVNISGFTVVGAFGYYYPAGIYLNADYCNISNNVCSNNGCGISLHGSNNIILKNKCRDNNEYGIEIGGNSNLISKNILINNSYGIGFAGYTYSMENVIADNVVMENDWGIFVSEGWATSATLISNNIIRGNLVKNNEFGLILAFGISGGDEGSTNNTLKNNEISNNKYNFGVSGWCLENFLQNIDSSNTVNGRPIYYLINERDIIIDDAYNLGYIGLINSSNITIEDLTMSNNKEGILIANSYNITLKNLIIRNNWVGILFFSVNDSKIRDCVISHNEKEGVLIKYSNYNAVEDNKLSNNSCGILLDDSNYNEITKNNCSNNGEGVSLLGSNNNRITNNDCLNNRGDYYLGDGIYLEYSSNNIIINNVCSNNGYGIYLYESNSNIVTNNNYSSNNYGICTYYSNNNDIYLNNFINNSIENIFYHISTNIWNSTEPITYIYNGKTYINYLGNYWSDHECEDANGDGICDSPYVIDSDNQDNYPLVKPFENYQIQEKWSFAIITDLHIGYGIPDFGTDGWNDTLTGNPALDNYYLTKRLEAVVDWINNHIDDYNIKFVAVLGDITDTAEKSEFIKAKEILDRLNVSYIPIIGNHDMRPYTQCQGNPPSDRTAYNYYGQGEISRTYFQEIFNTTFLDKQFKRLRTNWEKQWENGATNYYQNFAFEYQNITFIFLDFNPGDHAPYPKGGIMPWAILHNETYNWFREQLEKNRSEKIIVFSHYAFGWPHPFIFKNHLDAIKSLIKSYDCEVYNFAGHDHINDVGSWAGGKIIRTEAVLEESSKVIRIVQIQGNEITYDILKPEEGELKPAVNPYITFNPKNIGVGMNITFKAGGRLPPTPAPAPTPEQIQTPYSWDLNGDGIIDSTSYAPKYNYSEPGTYYVFLTIEDDGNRETVWQRITVHPYQIPAWVIEAGVEAAELYFTLAFEEDVNLTEVAQNTFELVRVFARHSEIKPVAEMAIHFENATEDINLTNLIADTNITQRKSILYMIEWPEVVERSKVLYIPYTGKGAVYVCRNATNLEEVNFENSDFIIRTGEEKEGMFLSLVYFNDTPYYALYNVTGTGAGETDFSIWYVDDDFKDYPNAEFSSIQQAVNAANNSDWIIVHNGTYEENIIVNKSLNIKAVGNVTVKAFEITVDYVNISGFRIVNGNTGIYLCNADNCNISNNICENNSIGIYLNCSNHNRIMGNNCSLNLRGIYLINSDNNSILNDIIESNGCGIDIEYSNNNSISYNNISSNNYGHGIELEDSNKNGILYNNILNNGDGIALVRSNNNSVSENNISSNYWYGIYLLNSNKNIIYMNNFINNGDNAYSYNSTNILNSTEPITYTYRGSEFTNYMGNYWDDYNGSDANGDGIGDTPYSIDGDKDNYPLMEPWENYFVVTPVPNQPPIANFTYSPEKPVVNQSVTFDASSSYDPDGNITSYEWDFGDGNITNTTHEILNHSYSEAGSYEVTLTVTDDKGATNSTTKIITVYSPTAIFDTGRPENPYPSISGEFVGTIRTNTTIIATKLYTYPCEGTGGHTEHALICNSTWCAYAEWEGYKEDWMNISFNKTVILMPYEIYNMTIVTGSYPQIHHTDALPTKNGWINCTSFVDANGKKYDNWIPAIRLE